MKIGHKKIRKNWITMIVFVVGGLLTIGLLSAWYGIYNANKISDSFEAYVKKEKMESVKEEVNNRIDEISYDFANAIDRDQKGVEKMVTRIAYAVETDEFIKNIDDPYLQNKAALEKFIELLTLEEEPELSIFAMDDQGILLYSGNDPSYVGYDFMKIKDIFGTSIGKDILLAKDNPEGVFVLHYWPESVDEDEQLMYSFCYNVQAFDFIIGVGDNYDTILDNLKKETFDRIETYYEGDDDYMFIVDYNSRIIEVHVDREKVGKQIDDLENVDGSMIHQKVMDLLKDQDDGFIFYDFRRNGNEQLQEKIAYVTKVKGLSVYFGKGFFLGDIHEEITNYKDEFKSRNYWFIILTQVLLAFVALGTYLFIRQGIKLQRKINEKEEGVYKHLFRMTDQGIVIFSQEGHILFENQWANRIFQKETMKISQLEKVYDQNDDRGRVYMYINDQQRTYYLNIEDEAIFYKGDPCTMKVIRDITEAYLREHQLESLAYKDPLTNLYNRRKLEKDFEHLFYGQKVQYGVIVLVDIDKFKDVNDEHGHSIGDDVLKLFARECRDRLRQEDGTYRYGGEEFSILIPHITTENAVSIIEKLNRMFYSRSKEIFGFHVTFSAGLVKIEGKNLKSLNQYIEEADELLYMAKADGRNRIKYREET